ncbi:MAG TPA: hypothetical protein VK850_07905 [Candidatus Binatia bacterium]|nr:hypothetical protein [Candidatus Binatia bacterium]
MNGEFKVDALPGYLAGIPTYSLCAERASCHCCAENFLRRTRLSANAALGAHEKHLLRVAELDAVQPLFTQILLDLRISRYGSTFGGETRRSAATPWRC